MGGRVRSVDVTSAAVTTLAGSTAGVAIDDTGSAARFGAFYDLSVVGGVTYVADHGNHSIRAVTDGGVVTTLAGSAGATGTTDGTGSGARFNNPFGIGTEGSDLFVTDQGNQRIRRITAAGVVTTLAGGGSFAADGVGAAAGFTVSMRAVVGDGAGNLYMSDGNAIRRIVISTGAVTTIAGDPFATPAFVNATGTSARFNQPWGLAHRGGILFVADYGNHVIRRIDLASGAVTTFAGTTSGSSDSSV
jgi:hypothetical protein